MQHRCSLRALALCAAALTPSAWSAVINVNVRTPAAIALPGVTVALADAAGKPLATAIADAQGSVSFAGVAAGTYTLAVSPNSDPVVPKTVVVAQADNVKVDLIAAADVSLGKIEVTATRLKEARIEISPKIGTTVYSVDSQLIESLGVGADTPLNNVLLRLPGVYQDSKASGSLHVRDDHANVQYRINGIQLPEGITGSASPSIRALPTKSTSLPGRCRRNTGCAPLASSTSKPRTAPSRVAPRSAFSAAGTTPFSQAPKSLARAAT
jgi:hypothetical protein